MARQTLVKNERFELFQTKLLAICVKKAGNWAALARDFPMSESHLYLLRIGKSKPGPEIFCRMLEYAGLLPTLCQLVDSHLTQLTSGVTDDSSKN